MKKLALIALVFCVGCGVNPPRKADPVEISGRATMAGKPLTDVTLNLQPTSGGGHAILPVKDGAFRGSVIPGKYTYFLAEGKNAAAFRAVPEKYRSGAMDRQVDINSGVSLDLKFD